MGDVVDGGDSTREHRWPHLSHAQRDELNDLFRLRREGGGECHRILACDPRGRQEDVLIAERIRPAHDVAAMLVAAAQPAVGDAEELVVVAAERGKPRDLRLPRPRCGSTDERRTGRERIRVKWQLIS